LNISKLTITLIVLCSVLAVSNIAFFIFFFHQSPPEPKEPIVIQKDKNEKITEEDIKQALSQAVHELREDAFANETAYMAFLLTFIGTMATLSGIAFAIYNFFQVSKVREYVVQGIEDGLDKLGEEYEKRVEKKYLNRVNKLEQFNQGFSKALTKSVFVQSNIKKPNNMIYLFNALIEYYAIKNYSASIESFKKFIDNNTSYKGYLCISLYKLYENAGLLEERVDEAFETLKTCYDNHCFVKDPLIYKYLNTEQTKQLFESLGNLESTLLDAEESMYQAIYEPWEKLFEKIS